MPKVEREASRAKAETVVRRAKAMARAVMERAKAVRVKASANLGATVPTPTALNMGVKLCALG